MVINQRFQHIADTNPAAFSHKVQSCFGFILQIRIECFFIGAGLTQFLLIPGFIKIQQE